MTNAATTKFITISTISDAWGDTTAAPEFNAVREACKIGEAAEAHGITVYTDETPPRDVREDGIEIDWFATWCREGWLWNDEQWIAFFAGC